MIHVVNKYKHTPTLFNDIYIGRGSIYGNKYSHIANKSKFSDVIAVDTREESIARYKEDLYKETEPSILIDSCREIKKMSLTQDVYLVCFCKPKSCHGDVLKEYIESLDA